MLKITGFIHKYWYHSSTHTRKLRYQAKQKNRIEQKVVLFHKYKVFHEVCMHNNIYPHILTSLVPHHKVMCLPLAQLHMLSICVLALITLCPVTSEVKLNQTEGLN